MKNANAPASSKTAPELPSIEVLKENPVVARKRRLRGTALTAIHLEGFNNVFELDVMVNLFEPPQREAFRTRIVEMRAGGMTEKAVSRAFGLTRSATQRGIALHRKMQSQGRTEPYEGLTVPLDGGPQECAPQPRAVSILSAAELPDRPDRSPSW